MERYSHKSGCDALAAGDEAEYTAGDRMTILLDLIMYGGKICVCMLERKSQIERKLTVTNIQAIPFI